MAKKGWLPNLTTHGNPVPTFFATWYPSRASSVGCILFYKINKKLCAAQHTCLTNADCKSGEGEGAGRKETHFPSCPSSHEKTQLDAKTLGEMSWLIFSSPHPPPTGPLPSFRPSTRPPFCRTTLSAHVSPRGGPHFFSSTQNEGHSNESQLSKYKYSKGENSGSNPFSPGIIVVSWEKYNKHPRWIQ